jgi:hypothetical protein
MRPFSVRLLGPGDESQLAVVARDETDFAGEPASFALNHEAAGCNCTLFVVRNQIDDLQGDMLTRFISS